MFELIPQSIIMPLYWNLVSSFSSDLVIHASLRLIYLCRENSQCSLVACTIISSRPERTISISSAPLIRYMRGEFSGNRYPSIFKILFFCYS